MKKPRWHYHGDVSIEHGGMFYNLDNARYDYAEAWRVTPCSDAGGPDNQFWIEHLTVLIDEDRRAQALACIGVTEDYYRSLTRAMRMHLRVGAAVSCGHYDRVESPTSSGCRTVQVGPADPFFGRRAGWDPIVCEVRLRGNASLRRYVRSLLGT